MQSPSYSPSGLSEQGGPPLWGMIAVFEDENQILRASRRAYEVGYRKIDAYTPFPVHGITENIGFKDNRVPVIIFLCGLFGALAGFGLQYYTTVIDYPMNIGGRPHFSWPSFIPPTFETTVLLAAFGAVIGMLALNGLPRPHHPLFGAPRFERATQDRFILSIEASDPLFDPVETRRFLESLGAESVSEVIDDDRGY